MIYSKKLSNSFTHRNSFSVTGCRKLFLVETDKLSAYTLKSNQADTLTLNGANFNLWSNLKALSFSVKSETTKAGTAYKVDINFQIPGLKGDVVNLLGELVNTKVTAIIEDKNGRFWLLGFQQGFSTSMDAGSDTGSFSVKMSNTQRTRITEVSVNLMKSLILNQEGNSTTPSPVFSTPQISAPVAGVVTSGNIRTSVVVTVNNFQIKNRDCFIKVTKALTVLLPSAPEEGEYHIFKATYDASEAPAIIKSTTHQVEGDTEFQINTPDGSVELEFQGGSWYQVG